MECGKTPPAAASAAQRHAEPVMEGPRRRGNKRKATAFSTSFSAPPKRHAKDRNPFSSLQLSHHGPLTRAARQSPLKFAIAEQPRRSTSGASEAFVVSGGGKTSSDPVRLDVEVVPEGPPVDTEFEAIRSRAANVHVAPSFAGWFSWKTIHPIEKQALASFFNGKTENRSPEIYLQIRNFIMKKFHTDPAVQIELKDLSELSSGDADAHQEVLDFLDHWGLINFHPFPPEETEAKSSKDNPPKNKAPLLEQLYKFEAIQSYITPSPKQRELHSVSPVLSLFREPTVVDELVAPVEPSVEYHCNSCSADCSRKRYHCQTQADFDLCSDCYNQGKFDTGMVQADFILMESAEVPGTGGASWTDQETLLLLEGVELFSENWSEIAEHVATKTKAQCIMHFLQMPIEDPFLEGADVNQAAHEIKTPTLSEKDSTNGTFSVKLEVQDNLEAKESDGSKVSDDMNESAPEKKESGKKEASPNMSEKEAAIGPSSEELIEKKPTGAVSSTNSVSPEVLDVLRSAFEVAGHYPDHGNFGSFAEAGNPVMSLVAFLAGLARQHSSFNLYQHSLKVISDSSAATRLALRHCYILEDPPEDDRNVVTNVSPAEGMEGGHLKDDGKSKQSNDKKEENGSGSKQSDDMGTASQNDNNGSNNKNESGSSLVDSEADGAKHINEPVSEEKGKSCSSQAEESSNISLPLQDGSKDSTTSQEKNCTSSETLPPKDVTKDSMASQETKSTVGETCELKSAAEGEPSNIEDLGNLISRKKAETSAALNDSDELAVLDDKSARATETDDNLAITRLKHAASTALAAAAVNAKLLANQEEMEIQQLAALIIEKQIHKLETKLSLFADIENIIIRTREQLDKTRHRLVHERSQILAARAGMMSQPMRPNPQLVPPGRSPLQYAAMMQGLKLPGATPLSAVKKQ